MSLLSDSTDWFAAIGSGAKVVGKGIFYTCIGFGVFLGVRNIYRGLYGLPNPTLAAQLLREGEQLEKAPLTDEELREIREMFSAGFIEVAKQQNLTQTEIDEGLEGLDGMIHFWRFSFAGMQMAEGGEGFVTKERFLQCLPTDNKDRQRLAGVAAG